MFKYKIIPEIGGSIMHAKNGSVGSDAFSLYIIILFVIFLIAVITMYQNFRINSLRKDIETLKTNQITSDIF